MKVDTVIWLAITNVQMLQRYEESMVDLETLLKLDPSNSAAKKELQLVVKSKEDEVCISCLSFLVVYFLVSGVSW